ncbi:MAG: type II secretion system minor pseudopilin GspH [Pseudomonadota bacterium]|nr:type II secretion system minor pseudopilin GspH [Pseudomonadota bacterium]
MPTSTTGSWNKLARRSIRSVTPAGFTLIELLVVIVIIGVVLSFATLGFRSGDRSRALAYEAERAFYCLSLAAEEALLSERHLGFQMTPKGYGFMEFGAAGWVLSPKNPCAPRDWPEWLEADLVVEGNALEAPDEDTPVPEIYVLAGGEMSPFSLILSHQSMAFRIAGDVLGRVTLEPVAP